MDDKLAAALGRLISVRYRDTQGLAIGQLAQLSWLVEEIDKIVVLVRNDNRFTHLIPEEIHEQARERTDSTTGSGEEV